MASAPAAEDVCLVARAIPLPASKKNGAPISTDALAAHLSSTLSLGAKEAKKPEEPGKKPEGGKKHREEAGMSPADHLALQSLRSSALARKTNTTAKFSRDCRNLFADLMAGGGEKEEKEEGKTKKKGKEEEKEEVKVEKNEQEKKEKEEKEEEKKEESTDKKEKDEKEKKSEGTDKEEEEKEVQLLARGPIRAPMVGRTGATFHPYSSAMPNSSAGSSYYTSVSPFNATAPQSAVLDQSSYNPMAAAGYGYLNSGYECGLPSNWSCGGWSNGRDSVLSSPSTTPDTTLVISPGGQNERSELPDDLSDFILEYSRRYSPILSRKHSLGSDGGGGDGSPRSNLSEEDSLCAPSGDSPLCAPQSSPAAPRGGGLANGSRTPPFNAIPATVTPKGLLMGATAGGGEQRARPAKERLRALIRSEDMDDAWAWTCKCIQRHPRALDFQDGDGDTLLHIVTAHLDLAKIYALVEQMLKSDTSAGEQQHPPAFDMPNRMGETPLMVAVQKRQAEVVDYLLEAGASPNSQSSRLERDTPLHYAATRGLTSIVRILCAHPQIALNAQNGMGLSPLLSAFKGHGEVEEESQSPVCTLEAAETLIRAGADVTMADATNGRTLVHMAVEKMAPGLVEVLRTNVREQEMAELVNRADFCGETPMRTLKAMRDDGEEARKAQMCLALITCGAETH